eukprot:93546-Pyramimonas_sp.AAC.2
MCAPAPHRAALSIAFDALAERGGFTADEAATLRAALEGLATWCADLLVHAPYLGQNRAQLLAGLQQAAVAHPGCDGLRRRPRCPQEIPGPGG